MLTRILAGVSLVLGIAAGGLGYLSYKQIERNGVLSAEKQQVEDALEASQELRRADAATLARRAQKNAATARETALLRHQLAAALATNGAWAATAVPEEVRNALREPISGRNPPNLGTRSPDRTGPGSVSLRDQPADGTGSRP